MAGLIKKLVFSVLALLLVYFAFSLSRPDSRDVSSRSDQVATPTNTDVSEFRIEIPETQSLAKSGLDDPSKDGWATEAFAEEAKKRLLKVFGEVEQWQSVIATDAQLSFAPASEVVYSEGSLTVRRSPELHTPRKFAVAFDQLVRPLNEVGTPHFHIKVIGVSLEPDLSTTTCIYEADASSHAVQIQQTGKFKCSWRHASNASPPRLIKLEFTEFEEVLRQSNSPWFADRTKATMGRTDAFNQQLSFGLNHWLERIERTHGMDDAVRTGLAIGDANGDGLEDVYVCQGPGLPNLLLLHQVDGSVIEVAASAGVDFLDLSSSALFLDLDNDGDQDLAVGTTAGLIVMENTSAKSQTSDTSSLPMFEQRAQLATEMTDSQSLAAADFDLDGDVDIFLCAYRHQSGRLQGDFIFHDATTGGRNYLFRNSGDWQVDDVTQASGLGDGATRYSLAASWEDYDNDGDPDLYVANDYGRNYLYQNERGRFRDATDEAGLTDTGFGMSVSWGDANRDGNLDLYIGNMFSSAGSRITSQERFQEDAPVEKRALYERMARGNSLFLNLADGFEDATTGANVGMGRWAWSSVFGDINNDGWEDLIVANGYITADESGDL